MRKNGLKARLFSIILATSLAVSSTYVTPPVVVQAEKGEGTVYATRSFDANYDNQYAYSGNDLGCTYTKEKTTFKVWTPEASAVVLCRYEKGNGGSVIEELPMTKGDKGVWSVTVNGDIVNTYYTYKVTVNGKTNEAVDIYAKAAGVNGQRAMVVDLDSTDPVGWDKKYQREKTLLSDIIVWEVHIRDFSIDVSSGVKEENRGKYKAFTEDDTTVNGQGKVASCVNYLKQLGVTHVQLMPMYDYASVDETKVTNSLGSNYNWGYDPLNYNVPEGSYSSDPYDGNVRITEMKEMIQALHDAGIKVIMDVVYNHTYDTADSNFTKIMPDYYYKLNSDLSYNNQSGCGNATRSESAMYRKFMIDSLSYWAEEYNLDGFRFDLMGIHDVTTMNQIRETLDKKFGEDTIVLYGEGWTGDGKYDSNSAHKANEARLDDGIGYFNDQIRDSIKGEHKFDGTIGLVQTGYSSGAYLAEGEKWPNNVYGGIMGSVGSTGGQYGMWRPFWSKSSNCSLSYTSAHDNLTLWDKLSAVVGKNYNSTDEKMLKMNKMAGSVILVSKGGAFMQAGEEFARTKNGDDNSYNSPDSVNKIDWNRVDTYSAIEKYYEGMIKIRKAFSGFTSITTRSSDNWNPNNNNLTWISNVKDQYPTGLFGFYESNNVSGEWSKICVLINNATTEQSTTLNESNWVVIADGNTAGLTKIKEVGSNVTVPAKSVMVLVPKATFEACNITENRAPVITADASYEVAAGEKLSFTVKASDPDGDKVTLTASGVPAGAIFDASTGSFQWESPVAGTYTVVVTASDESATTTKNITITVTEKTTALKKLVEEAESQEFKEGSITADIWKPYSEALTQAKAVIAAGETEDGKIQTALNNLKTAYEAVKGEVTARDTLEDKRASAKEKLATAQADSANYDAEAIKDLKTVIEEADNILAKVNVAKCYSNKVEDLEDAMTACVSLKANPTIRVMAKEWSNPAVYVWTGTGDSANKIAGEWPGTKLTTRDSEGYYVLELPEGTTDYNVIVNDGAAGTKTQTTDITGVKGSIDITVTSFTGKTCAATTEEHEVGTGEVTVDKSKLEAYLATVEIPSQSNEAVERLAKSVENGQAVVADTAATQVQVNQTLRDLRQCVLAVENNIEVVPTVEPTVTVTPSVEPTMTVTPTVEPTPVVSLTPSVEPTVTPTREPVTGKVKLHYKSDSDNVTMMYQNRSAANKNQWYTVTMEAEGNGWFGYTVENSTSVKFKFVVGELTEEGSCAEGEWWYYDGGLDTVNPDETVVTPTPTTAITVAPTSTVAPTGTVTPTVIVRPTVTDVAEPTITVTKVPTVIATVTATPTVTIEPTVTEVPTITPVPTVTEVPAPTATVIPTVTEKPTATPTPVVSDISLDVSAVNTTQAKLSWAKVKNASQYKIYRSTSKSGKETLVGTVAGNKALTYTDRKLTCGKVYYYSVKAYSKVNGTRTCVAQSSKVRVSIKPEKVTSLNAKNRTNGRVKLTWKRLKNVSGYQVYYSTSKTKGYKRLATRNGSYLNNYTTKKLTKKKRYYFKVRGYKNVNGRKVYGSYSEVKSIRIK